MSVSTSLIEIPQDIQAEIEDIAADLSQIYGFDFPLEMLEDCYRQIGHVDKVRVIAGHVKVHVNIDPDDIFDEDRMARHFTRIERIFQHLIDEHLS